MLSFTGGVARGLLTPLHLHPRFFFQRVGANYGAWVLRFGVVFGSLVGALGTCLLRLVNHRESRVHVAVDWYNSKNVRVALFRLGET